MKSKRKIIVISIFILIIGVFIAGYCYVSDYYHANNTCNAYLNSSDQIIVTKQKDWISFTPRDKQYHAGFIFYPGAKVEETAYAQLISEIAEQGYLCILVKMPFRLAFLSPSKASVVMEQYPNIDEWYLGGHSLGGAMAADYASHHSIKLHGLILLGAYSASDLSNTDLSVLSVYGSEDKVLNREKLQKSNQVMPDDFKEYVIMGGNHSYYGDYGEQKGDGTATITHKQQITETVNEIIKFMK